MDPENTVFVPDIKPVTDDAMEVAKPAAIRPPPKDEEFSEELKTKWLRFILGENRFYHSHEALGGRIQITFRSRTEAEASAIREAVANEITTTDPIQSLVNARSLAVKYGMACSLCSLQVGLDKKLAETYPEVSEYLKVEKNKGKELHEILREAADKILNGMSEARYGILVDAFGKFDNMCRSLMEKSTDPDFFSPEKRQG